MSIGVVFEATLKAHPELSTPIAVLKTFELDNLNTHLITDLLTHTNHNLAVRAGCHLFTTLTSTTLQLVSLDEFNTALTEQADTLIAGANKLRNDVAVNARGFVRGCVLVQGYSRVVMQVIRDAVEHGEVLDVYLVESLDTNVMIKAANALRSLEIPVHIIHSESIAYFMQRVDSVVIGAEAVVESGGIVNVAGSLQTAIVAKSFKKPVYVFAESYKFLKDALPVDQYDLPRPALFGFNQQQQQDTLTFESIQKEMMMCNPVSDYTPAEFISLIFTDRGILTTESVADEIG